MSHSPKGTFGATSKVAGIIAPAAPYTVEWVPESGGQNTQPGELWRQVEHSCSAQGGDG